MDYKEIFYKDSVEKQIVIKSDDELVNITNNELDGENMELTESICEKDELVFGACSAAELKFTVSGIQSSMKGKWLNGEIELKNEDISANPYKLGRYKVHSDKPTADRTSRTVIAYDALYDILMADVADWYNTILPESDSRVRLRDFRDSFFNHFEIIQEDINLVNDDMWVEKTVEPSELSGATVLNCICEINGCLGHINRNGRFKYIYLEPIASPEDISKSLYTSSTYEDYIVHSIDKLQIRQEEDDIGVIVGEGDNSYIIEDNFLVYGKSSAELGNIAGRILARIKGLAYRPFTVECIGNPCISVGAAVRVSSTYETIDSYVLKRTLKGVQSLSDTYEAAGNEYRTSKVNSLQKQIIQLKGKSNTLKRSIEETKNTISDIEQGLKNEITMNASEFDTKLQNLQSQVDGTIEVIYGHEQPTIENYPAYNWTAGPKIGDTLVEGLCFTYSDEAYRKHQRTLYYDEDEAVTYRFIQSSGIWVWEPLANTEFSMLQKQITDLNLTAQGITADVESLSTLITNDYITEVDARTLASVTADGIMADVSKTYARDDVVQKMQLTIKATAEEMDLKVEKDKLIAEINARAGKVKISADAVDLTGLVTISSLQKSGETVINADNITTGTIKALLLAGCTMEGGAISIGGNNIIMNEKGLWVIGECAADKPAYMISNQGEISQYWTDGIRRFYTNGLSVSGTWVTHFDEYTASSNWYQICIAANNTSDAREKNTIKSLDDEENMNQLFDCLKPSAFYYNKGSGYIETQRHMGFIAQDVSDAIKQAGIKCDMALFDHFNEDKLGVNKQELIALCVWQVQKLKGRISKLEEIIGGAA